MGSLYMQDHKGVTVDHISRLLPDLLPIGKFLCSGKLLATDPCYTTVEPRLNETISKVKTGIWRVLIARSDEGEWGVRNAALIAVHSQTVPAKRYWDIKSWGVIDGKVNILSKWQDTNKGFGVDSGQAGLFDLHFWTNYTKLHDKNVREENLGEVLYEKCNALKAPACTISGGLQWNWGCSGESGLGDGGYPIYVRRSGDLVVGVILDYLDFLPRFLEQRLIQTVSLDDCATLLSALNHEENKTILEQRLKGN